MWRQNVSTTPATRLDVINLQEQLDMRLQQQQVGKDRHIKQTKIQNGCKSLNRQLSNTAILNSLSTRTSHISMPTEFYRNNKTGPRNWHLSDQTRTVHAMFRRIDPSSDDQLCRKGFIIVACQRRDENDYRSVPSFVLQQHSFRNEESVAS